MLDDRIRRSLRYALQLVAFASLKLLERNFEACMDKYAAPKPSTGNADKFNGEVLIVALTSSGFVSAFQLRIVGPSLNFKQNFTVKL